jgi:hypothetical protein
MEPVQAFHGISSIHNFCTQIPNPVHLLVLGRNDYKIVRPDTPSKWERGLSGLTCRDDNDDD